MQSLLTWLFQIKTTDEDELRRGQTTIVLALLMIGLALLAVPISLLTDSGWRGIGIIAVGISAYLVTIALARAGKTTWSAFVLIAFITAPILFPIATVSSPSTPFTSPFYLILSLLVAGLTLTPILIWLALAVNLIGLLIAWNLAGVALFATPLETALETAAIFLQVGTAFFVFIGGRITDSALRAARQAREEARRAADQLAALNASLEAQVAQRTAALQTALRDLEQRTAEQARLLAENEQQRQAIRELSTPLLPVRAATLVMPLIGALDSARIAEMQQRALAELDRAGARELLIDVTGVPVIDTQVAKGLAQLVDAARLMGARVILVGIRPEVAQTLVTLGVDWHQVRAFSTLEAALAMLATAQTR